MDVVIGAPIYRKGTYVIDKFLENQRDIQREYPSCELVLATNEVDLAGELERQLDSYGLRGTVISYETVKPGYARNKVWHIACGREALRRYMVLHTEARYFLSVDTDMVYDPGVIERLQHEIQNCDAVFSGYEMRDNGIGLAGGGCIMLNRATIEKVRFRCIEFKNGETITEDNALELDLFRLRRRVKKGFFISIAHYINMAEAKVVTPREVGRLYRMMNHALIRYALIRISIIVHYNIPWKLKIMSNRFFRA